MDNETLIKFVENMRAGGQTDDMIAQSLIDAGHNKLAVFNLMGVSSFGELNPQAQPTAPDPNVGAVDETGQPLISEDNLPKEVGQRSPKRLSRQEMRQRQQDQHKARSRPRSRRTRQPEPEPELQAAELPPVQEAIAAEPDPESTPPPEPVVEPEQPKPTPEELAPPESAQAAPAEVEATQSPADNITVEPAPMNGVSAPDKRAPNEDYGHHTFDDFMGRVQDHKELEAHYDHRPPKAAQTLPSSSFKKQPRVAPISTPPPQPRIEETETPKETEPTTPAPEEKPNKPGTSADLVALSSPGTPSEKTVDTHIEEEKPAAQADTKPVTDPKKLKLTDIKAPDRAKSSKKDDVPKALQKTGINGKLDALTGRKLVLVGAIAFGVIILGLAVLVIL